MQSALRRLAQNRRNIIAILLGAACLAGVLAYALQNEKKRPQKTKIRECLDRSPMRGEPGPLRLQLGEFKFECTKCHRPERSAAAAAYALRGGDFPSMPKFWSGTFPHSSLKLDHGRNDQCFDCHNKDKRDTYLANDGGEIPNNESQRLCSKCHGLTYRDWLKGAHGRRAGYWDAKTGDATYLTCIQCHNPHEPPFGKLKPMPGPKQRGDRTKINHAKKDHAKEGDA